MTRLSTPVVSVVIPTLDRPGFLARALHSAIRQEQVDVEIVIVDDGSRQPVDELIRDDLQPHIRVMRHDVPRGVAAARNAGIAAARGEWLAFLDDDDVWAPQKLCRQLGVARATGADFVFVGGVVITGDGRILAVDDAPADTSDLHRMLLARNWVPCGASNVLAKTGLVRTLGGFDAGLSTLADWDLSIRLSHTGRPATGPWRLIAYSIHEGNMHRDESLLAAELERFDRKYADARRATGVSLDQDWWLDWRAGVQRSAGRGRLAGRLYWRLGWLRRSPGTIALGAALLLGGQRVRHLARRLTHTEPPQVDVLDRPPWLPGALEPPERALLEVFRPASLSLVRRDGALLMPAGRLDSISGPRGSA